jgi:hypothetical protein
MEQIDIMLKDLNYNSVNNLIYTITYNSKTSETCYIDGNSNLVL